eukprot:4906895-Alexandrium_andersonii.AAC.1
MVDGQVGHDRDVCGPEGGAGPLGGGALSDPESTRARGLDLGHAMMRQRALYLKVVRQLGHNTRL